MAKQVLCYLKNTSSLGIKWRSNQTGYRSDGRYGELEMVEYIYNSYAGDIKDQKSITRQCFFLVGAIMN